MFVIALLLPDQAGQDEQSNILRMRHQTIPKARWMTLLSECNIYDVEAYLKKTTTKICIDTYGHV